ncbi:MAG: TerC family protein, partial [Hyphomicrobiaceae bacterium]
MPDFFSAQFIRLLTEIFWVNIILSGDNAVVIALACRGLPPRQRQWGIALGAGVAIALRLIFLVILGALLKWPLLKIVGGILLLYIAVKLLIDDSGGHGEEAG